MKVLLTQLQYYAKSLDMRLLDETKYTDEYFNSKIDTALEMTATERQTFYAQEVLDLKEYIEDDTNQFEVEMAEEVTGWRNIFSTQLPNDTSSIQGAKVNIPITSEALIVKPKEDNRVILYLNPNNMDTTDTKYTVTFEYYFFPRTDNFTEIFMTPDIYHMVKHAIGMIIYEDIRDFEKEALMEKRFNQSKSTVMNGLDVYGNDIVKPNWIGV